MMSLKIIFRPVLGDKNAIKNFNKRVMHHEHISKTFTRTKKDKTTFYCYEPSDDLEDIDVICCQFAGLFGNIVFWGYVEEVYETYRTWYNIMFNKSFFSRIGSTTTDNSDPQKSNYQVLYSEDGVIFGLQDICHLPTTLILQDRPYVYNEERYQSYMSDQAGRINKERGRKYYNGNWVDHLPKEFELVEPGELPDMSEE